MNKREPWSDNPTDAEVLKELYAFKENELRTDWIGEVVIEPMPILADRWEWNQQSTHNAEIKSWHVTVSYNSPYRPRILCFTIIQCDEGGLSDGEGWAVCRRWISYGVHLSSDELVALARLLVRGGIPELIFTEVL